MKIWRYWLTETRPLRCEGASCDPFECNFRVTVGSNESESDARERLEAIFAELAEWYGSGEQYSEEDVLIARMKMKRYDDTPSWIDEYGRRRQDYAVCRFVCAKGRRLDSPAIALHDEKTMCESGLPLA